jgi:hypothetical protein
MAGKSIVSFVGLVSTFALEGEPSPVNKALATAYTEVEIEAIMETPLAVLPTPQLKITPSLANRGSVKMHLAP